MIQVTLWDDPEGSGVWLLSEGHAEPPENKSDREPALVCAGISSLLLTLAVYTQGLESNDSLKGFKGDQSGFLQILIQPHYFLFVEFVITGLRQIALEYGSQHIAVENRGKRIFPIA